MEQGRQSPPPEQQHPSQGTEPVASKPNDQGAAPSLDHAKEASDKQKHDTLPSNPSNVMEDKAKEKVAKTT